MNTSNRLLIVAAIVAAIYAGVFWIYLRGKPPEVSPFEKDVTAVPAQLGKWRGTPVEQDERLFVRVGADAAADYAFRDPAGRVVTAHIAWWSQYTTAIRHPPLICYGEAGFSLVNSKDVSLPRSGESGIPAHLVQFERNAQQFQVMYWYQLGERIVLDNGQVRDAFWRLRGQRVWPPMLKVMLQTSAPTAAEAESQIKDLGALLYDWLNQPNLPSPAKAAEGDQPGLPSPARAGEGQGVRGQ